MGDAHYFRGSYQLQQYTPINRQFTFAFNGDLGWGQAIGDSPYPVFKNFYGGGLGSVRGFAPGTLGPRDVTGSIVGGTRKVALNGELFHIPDDLAWASIVPTRFGLAAFAARLPSEYEAVAREASDVFVIGREAYTLLMDEVPGFARALLSAGWRPMSGGAFIVYESLIDDDRRQNAFGLLMSLNMLIETPGGYDFTGADCQGWLREAGFSETRVEHLVDVAGAALDGLDVFRSRQNLMLIRDSESLQHNANTSHKWGCITAN